STSWVPVGDSIVERKWNFGDATPLLTGNVIAPVHNYLNTGVYTVSLKIKTAQNCEKTYYAPVVVQDSSITPPTTDPIKILSIFPNPAVSQTQTVVWSLHNNVQAEIAVYDIYGVKKWFVNKLLLQGNNITVVPTSLLLPGPYYLRVTTMYGVKSRIFFKQ
ncbi:MAG: Secretion system C-terminal sorting domain, partial [Chitinophagaceae bacterium]|nr:Secretion system C-terminal sorting domain [Chitinophagaceae bacterium]